MTHEENIIKKARQSLNEKVLDIVTECCEADTPQTEVITNAEKFKEIFGIYATEMWAMPEHDFLEWLNTETKKKTTT